VEARSPRARGPDSGGRGTARQGGAAGRLRLVGNKQGIFLKGHIQCIYNLSAHIKSLLSILNLGHI
jgi:hypothetical protein